MKPLTAKEVKDAKPKLNSNGKLVKYELVDSTRDRGVGRLIVKVLPSGTKEFAYKYKIKGKRHYIKLGRYPAMSLAVARNNIVPLINILTAGKDPKKELEKEKKQEESVEYSDSMQGNITQLFHAYTDKMKRDKKRTYVAVLSALEKEVYPVIPGDTKAKDVTRQQIKQVISNLIERGAVIQSNHVRSYLMTAFNCGLKHDNDPAVLVQNIKFGIESNPVVGIPKQKDGKPGDNFLTIDETRHVIAAFIDTVAVGYKIDALLKLCFYTGGQRPYELCTSTWNNVDWKEKTLFIAAEFSKNNKPHLIPLTNSAINILRELENISKGSKFIFPQDNIIKHLRTDSFSTAVIRYRESNPEFKSFVPRDIRRTCKTLMGALHISKEIRDRIQNHAFNDVSSKHYDRYDYLSEKREALVIWERTLLNLPEEDN
ncbi:tyrosine-type recombinase/integrase [Moritella marina]|uniref:tyrosine-type recombinase/integrase n=1 Tax=Moritella marina TaxID=90736 RepID=UPI003704567F